MRLSIDVRGGKQRLVFTADDAVLHACRELIADLAGHHDGLRPPAA